MVSITSKTGSSDGVFFDELPTSNFADLVPRVSKAKTLDGGVVYDHRGMITADREFTIIAELTATQTAAIKNIVENETYVNLACKEGFFEGVVESVKNDKGVTVIRFWIYEPIAITASNTKRMYCHETVKLTESISISVA